MTLTVRRVHGAEIRPLTELEIARVQRREKRDEPHTFLVTLPKISRPLVFSSLMTWTFAAATIERSRAEPLRLPVPENVGRSFWMVGEEVFSVSDLAVTPGDVLALLRAQAQRREMTLRRARAAASLQGTHVLPNKFEAQN